MQAFTIWAVFFAAFVAFVTAGKCPDWLAYTGCAFFPLWLLACLAADAKNSEERFGGWGRFLTAPYDTLLRGFNSGLPKLLLPETMETSPPPVRGGKNLLFHLADLFDYWTDLRVATSADLAPLRKNPWSWPVFDTALMIAVAYPLLLAVGSWALSGQAFLGSLPLLWDNDDSWTRLVVLGLVIGGTVAQITYVATGEKAFEKVADYMPFVVIGLSIYAGFTTPYGTAIGVAAVTVFALQGTFLTANVVFIVIFSMVAFATGVQWLIAVAIFLGFSTAGGASIAAAKAAERGHGARAMVAIWVVCSVTVAIAVLSIAPDNRAFAWVIGFALLPLINAPFDYVSYGLTISLLRNGAAHGIARRIANGVADVVAALLMFAALSITLLLIMGAINALRTEALFDIATILFQVRFDPGAAAWLIAMVASTLVPTALHLLVVICSFATLFSQDAYKRILAKFDDQDGPPPLFSTLQMTGFLALWIAALLVPLAGLGWGAMMAAEPVRLAYASALEWIGLATGILTLT